MLKTELLKIPMQLVQHVNEQKLFKALGVYLMLKASCDGHVVLTKVQAPVKLTTLGRFKLTTAGRFKLTTSGRSKLTTR